MAVHHPATIVPGKLELLQAWVPHQPWAADVDASVLTRLGSYRFDDPDLDAEVGVETHLLGAADGQVLQVPLTYRGAPREEAGDSLVTTMTHTTLGDRWVYDAVHDPVYGAVLATAVLTGGREADLFAATDAGLVPEPTTTHVRGSGTLPAAAVPQLGPPVVEHDGWTTRIDVGVALTLLRLPLAGFQTGDGALTLTGTWPGRTTPALLATAQAGRPRPSRNSRTSASVEESES